MLNILICIPLQLHGEARLNEFVVSQILLRHILFGQEEEKKKRKKRET